MLNESFPAWQKDSRSLTMRPVDASSGFALRKTNDGQNEPGNESDYSYRAIQSDRIEKEQCKLRQIHGFR